MMKYFTLEDWIAGQDLANYDPEPGWLVADQYKQYVKSVQDRLPTDLRRLVNEYSLHDAPCGIS